MSLVYYNIFHEKEDPGCPKPHEYSDNNYIVIIGIGILIGSILSLSHIS